MEDVPRRRLERKSGSSSRSPSLSRRPSLKDKKSAGTITKIKGKKSGATASKKERWLLTRKTWRYMSDAVGNLLPESHRSSSSGSAAASSAGVSGSGWIAGTGRRTSSGGGLGTGLLEAVAGPSSSIGIVSASASFHSHPADIPGSSVSRPTSMPGAIPLGGGGASSGGGSVVQTGSGSKGSSTVTSPTYGGIMAFPSHRPGVTPTGPGPGKMFSSTAQSQHVLVATDRFFPPSDDIPTLEKHFDAVCSKEKRFLLWTRTKAKGLSGPALRDQKVKHQQNQQEKKEKKSGYKQSSSSGHRDSSGSIFEVIHSKLHFGSSSTTGAGGEISETGNKDNIAVGAEGYYSPGTEDEDNDDDQDEVTVRERRKSSTASSITSTIGAAAHGLTFFHPLSTFSSHGSESSYSMILSPHGTKICRNTGTQTDPFPEELLIRFRLQAVEEERLQRQISPNDQSDTTSVESPLSPGRLEDTQKLPSPPPTTSTTSPVSPTSTDVGRSGRESQEKLLETPASSTRPSISGQSESMATTKSGETSTTATTSAIAGGPDKKSSEESGYSSSISDTVMRYLRMVRKNSKADNKDTIDKFKTVNYDRSLRNIKSKNVTVEEALAHEKMKEEAAQQLKQQQELQSLNMPSLVSLQKEKDRESGGVISSSVGQISFGSPPPFETDGMGSDGSPSCLTSPELPIEKVEIQIGQGPQGSISPTSLSPTSPTLSSPGGSEPKQGKISKSKKQKQFAILPMTEKEATTALEHLQQRERQYSIIDDSDIPPSSPPPPPPIFDSPEKDGMEYQTHQASISFPLQQQQETVVAPPASIGIQAGESLIRFLKNLTFNPLGRKMSDFSSSCCSSESPAEVISPRYSFAAATVISGNASDTEPVDKGQTQATGTAMFDAGAIKTMRQQHNKSMRIPQIGKGVSAPAEAPAAQPPPPRKASISKSSQLKGATGPLSSSWTGGSTITIEAAVSAAAFKKASSVQQMATRPGSTVGPQNVAPSTTTSSSYSLSQLFHYGQSKSVRSRENPGGESPSTGSTPVTPTTSSMGGSSGGLMKSFFSSTPFSSTFGLKRSTLRKPTSTTSLTITTNTGSDSFGGRGGGNVPPPTTTSSPNLLSLIQSSAASAGSGFSNLFTSSRSGGGSGTSVTSTSASRNSGGGDFPQASLVITSTAASSVMQKSKSSSSVLPLYGSSGSVSAVPGAGSTSAHLRISPSGSISGAGDGLSVPGGSGSGGGGNEVPAATAAPASSSAGRLISKTKLFKTRSKSSTRATTSSSGSGVCSWSPQGRCKWKSVTGKVVTLDGTTLLGLSEVERVTLQEIALEKLRALNLGVDVKIPKEKVGAGQQKPKRRPYLLKKKALSTGFFESGSKGQDTKEASGGGSGLVFGISLSQCVANDRLNQMKAAASAVAAGSTAGQNVSSKEEQQQQQPSHKRSQNGSRNSVSSVFDMPKEDKDSLQPFSQPQALASVPALVTACIAHLENYGLHTTGIFRVSTSLKRIRQLREDIDSGKEIVFGEEHSPHDVAALLKEFLRDLPEPLLCRDLYQAFLKTQKIRNRKLQLEAIQHLVQLLPLSSRDTLAALLKFFANVVANASETRSKTGELLPGNKMEGYSLATLIAPNILPCMPTEGAAIAASTSSMDQNAALTKERRESIDLVNYMISNYSTIFDVTPELLHDVYLHLMDTNPEAIEGILRQKYGTHDEAMDELDTTSSVFEESEGNETLEPEEAFNPATVSAASSRMYRRREEILHEGAGKGGTEEKRRSRGRKEDDQGVTLSDVEKQPQSGGESDSSAGGRSTSRWFRRSRGDTKGRTSSDSGSEKVKGSSRKRESSLFEPKRASSLDSVNIQEPSRSIRVSPKPTSAVSSGAAVEPVNPARPLSGSDQSLRVPDHLLNARRQSSPVLESSGIITASLKIPVPVPLNIDDTDIPFIEDENNLEGSGGFGSSSAASAGGPSISPYLHHHHRNLYQQQSQQHIQSSSLQQLPSHSQQQKYPSSIYQYPSPHHQFHQMQDYPGTSTDPTGDALVRGRSMSTDSSIPFKTTSSSAMTTPISSPPRQPSSEVSSPTEFSPPTSPPLGGTFPVEEMTARMLIGSSSATPSTVTALSTSPSMHHFHQGAVTMTTPSSAITYPYTPAYSREPVLESKSAGSTPVVKPKVEKATGVSPPVSISSPSSASSRGIVAGSSPHLSQKANPSQGAIASLAISSSKVGEVGAKSVPFTSLSSSSSSSQPSQLVSTQPLSSYSMRQPASTESPPSTQKQLTPPSTAMLLPAGEPKGLGKETKGANIGGLIKSKTADFEKLSTSLISETSEQTGNGSSSSSSTTGQTLITPTVTTSPPTAASASPPQTSHSHHQIYSIAPKMRLRSQENVLLKQQFLLRQQQQHQQGESGTTRRERGSSQKTDNSEENIPLPAVAQPEQKQVSSRESSGVGSVSPAQSSATTSTGGGRALSRRRIVGSASSSAIMSSSSKSSGGGAPTRSRTRDFDASLAGTSAASSQLLQISQLPDMTPSGVATTSGSATITTATTTSSGSSPSRWKRSEIIASRQHSQSSSDPETFV